MLQLYKRIYSSTRENIQVDQDGNEISWDNVPIIIWKFKDEQGNIWVTSSDVGSSEDDVRTTLVNM